MFVFIYIVTTTCSFSSDENQAVHNIWVTGHKLGAIPFICFLTSFCDKIMLYEIPCDSDFLLLVFF